MRCVVGELGLVLATLKHKEADGKHHGNAQQHCPQRPRKGQQELKPRWVLHLREYQHPQAKVVVRLREEKVSLLGREHVRALRTAISRFCGKGLYSSNLPNPVWLF